MPDVATLILPPTGLFSCDEASTPIPLAGVSVEATITGFCARVVGRSALPQRRGAADRGGLRVPARRRRGGLRLRGRHRRRRRRRRGQGTRRGLPSSTTRRSSRATARSCSTRSGPTCSRRASATCRPARKSLVRLTYVTELTVATARLRFTMPTTVAPRYAPAEDQRGVGRPDSETLNPPVAWQVPYGLHLRVRLQMPGAITRPLVAVASDRDGARDGHAIVTLAAQEAALDRDFVLSVDATALEDAPGLDRADDGAAVAVAFVPRSARHARRRRGRVPRRSIRIDGGHVDRGGPQRPAAVPALDDARLLLQHRRLRVHVRVAVSREPRLRRGEPGDATRTSSAPRPTSAGPRSCRRCSSCSSSRRGGAAAAGGRPDRRRGHQHRCGDRARRVACRARTGVRVRHRRRRRASTSSSGLARAGGGTAEFIHPGERIEAKVVRQVSRLLSPARHRRAHWNGSAATSPRHRPTCRPSSVISSCSHTGSSPTRCRGPCGCQRGARQGRSHGRCRSSGWDSPTLPSRSRRDRRERRGDRDACGARAHSRTRGERGVADLARLASSTIVDRRRAGSRSST